AFANGPAGAATLYGIDAATDALYVQNATDGTTTMVGTGLGLDAAAVGGFDVPDGVSADPGTARATGDGFAALTVGGVTGLYRIDLTTGAAHLVGRIGDGTAVVPGFTLAPAGAVEFASATYSVAEAGGNATIALTRTGGSAGAISATVAVTGGTATPGTDFTGGPYTVNFADGQTTATLNVPFAGDRTPEGPETIVLAVTGVSGAGAVATTSTTTLTVRDRPQLFA